MPSRRPQRTSGSPPRRPRPNPPKRPLPALLRPSPGGNHLPAASAPLRTPRPARAGNGRSLGRRPRDTPLHGDRRRGWGLLRRADGSLRARRRGGPLEANGGRGAPLWRGGGTGARLFGRMAAAFPHGAIVGLGGARADARRPATAGRAHARGGRASPRGRRHRRLADPLRPRRGTKPPSRNASARRRAGGRRDGPDADRTAEPE